ncbi:MAG TPA: hypothetical protein VFL57_00185 [Bryobacteraceae bacterium]|nr:hypothetical protein [Bryobacteraceae bacterium]
MFFRREKPRKLSFDDYLQRVRESGFEVKPEASGRARASRHGCAAVIEEIAGAGRPRVHRAGVIVGDEIALLVDAGFQKFLLTPGGRKMPALAAHLKALHDFQEDLREALGLTSLYNEGLGTVSNAHLYDRVEDRDHGVPARPWEPANR